MTVLSRLVAWGPIRAVRESIRNKLLLTLTLLALVPLVALSTFSYYLIVRSVRRGQLDYLAMAAREREMQVRGQAASNQRLLESTARQRFLRDRLKEWKDAADRE